jgi:hypothetical protein
VSDYYDRQGNPLTDEEHLAIRVRASKSGEDVKRVALDVLPGDVRISTVWLGLDHGWGGGPPLIFETLVFGGPMDGEMDRYSTEAQAVEGHARMVEAVRAARAPGAEEGR